MEWKTFASDTFGYSVDLPASFAVVTGNREAANVQFMMPRQPQHLIVHIVESSDSLAAYLAAKDEGDKTNYEGKPSSEVLASSATTIDSHDAVVRREMWNAAGFEAVALYVKSGDRVYQFAVYDSGSMGVDAALLSFAERVFASLDWK